MKEPIWERWGALVISDKKLLVVGDFVSCEDSKDVWVVAGVTKRGLLILTKLVNPFEKEVIKYVENPDLVQIKDEFWWIKEMGKS